MKRNRILMAFVLIFSLVAAGIVSAQYATPSDDAVDELGQLVVGNGISVTVNNVLDNILDGGPEVSGFTADGLANVPLGVNQPALPIAIQLPSSFANTTVTLTIEEITGFEWNVPLNSSALLLTEFPFYLLESLLPAGTYTMELNGVDVFAVTIPAGYDPAPYVPPGARS